MANSTLIAIMGCDPVYKGNLITWDEIIFSSEVLGPDITEMGKLNYSDEHPVSGVVSNFG